MRSSRHLFAKDVPAVRLFSRSELLTWVGKLHVFLFHWVGWTLRWLLAGRTSEASLARGASAFKYTQAQKLRNFVETMYKLVS